MPNQAKEKVREMLAQLTNGDISLNDAADILYDCWLEDDEVIMQTCKAVLANWETQDDET